MNSKIKGLPKAILPILCLSLFWVFVSCGHQGGKGEKNRAELKRLIDKNSAARGGYGKLKEVRSLKISATYVQPGRKTPVTLTIKRPNLIFAEVLYPNSTMICGYDGRTAWWFDQARLSEPQILPPEDALIFTRYADFGDLFAAGEQLGREMELLGSEELEGQKVHKIKITLPDGIIRYVYLDATSFLDIRESYQSKSKREFVLEMIYKDFRAVDGVLFPFYHDIRGEQTIVERIETNIAVDDAIFKMPRKGGKTDRLGVSGFALELDAHLRASTEKDLFSGVVLVARAGKPVFKRAYGMADRERLVPNQENTRFCIGSMVKMFTAVAIAQLVEQGRLAYDDRIGKYLGAGWIRSEVGEKVKIAHLLSHTSGIAEYLTDEFHIASAKRYRTLQDYQPVVKEKSLTFQPGARWEYCNTGFILLGAIIEKVTGRGYWDYVQERIFDPAGMDGTIGFDRSRDLPQVAMGYEQVREGGKAFWRKTVFAGKINGQPAGGAFSTVEDLHRFAEALRSDLLIGGGSRELLMSAKPALGSGEYGYGFIVDRSRELGRVVGHGGAGPGVSGNFRMFVDGGVTMIILSNFTEASLPVSGKIRSLLPLI